MPPVTPSRTRRRSNGRMRSRWPARRLLGAAPRHDAIHDTPRRQLLQRAGRQLLLARRRSIAGELVQHAGMLGGNENAKILVRCPVLRIASPANNVTRCKNTHWMSLSIEERSI